MTLPTHKDIRDAISKSDDFDKYQAVMTLAAKIMIIGNLTDVDSLRKGGGFWKSTRHVDTYYTFEKKDQTVRGRWYLNALTGEISKEHG